MKRQWENKLCKYQKAECSGQKQGPLNVCLPLTPMSQSNYSDTWKLCPWCILGLPYYTHRSPSHGIHISHLKRKRVRTQSWGHQLPSALMFSYFLASIQPNSYHPSLWESVSCSAVRVAWALKGCPNIFVRSHTQIVSKRLTQVFILKARKDQKQISL